jgi:hypothetical protein
MSRRSAAIKEAHMRALLTAFAALALVACGQTTETPATTDTPITTAAPQTAAEATSQDTCGASQYQAMIGTNIAAATFPADGNIRVIMPNQPVTMDFSAQRLNVITDANGVITSLECY